MRRSLQYLTSVSFCLVSLGCSAVHRQPEGPLEVELQSWLRSNGSAQTSARLAVATQPFTGELIGFVARRHYVFNYITGDNQLQYYVRSDEEGDRQLTAREIKDFVEIGSPVSVMGFGLDPSRAWFQVNAHRPGFAELLIIHVNLPEGYRAEATGAEVLKHLGEVLDFGPQFELLQEASSVVDRSEKSLAERQRAYRRTIPGTIERLDRASELLAAVETLLTARVKYADVAGIQPDVGDLRVEGDEIEKEVRRLEDRVDRQRARQLESRLDTLKPELLSAWRRISEPRMLLVDWLEAGAPLVKLLGEYVQGSVALRSVGGLPKVRTEDLESALLALSDRLATARFLLDRGCEIEPVDRRKLALLVAEKIPDQSIASTIRKCGITFEASELEVKRFDRLGLGEEGKESLQSAFRVDWPPLRRIDGFD